MQQQGQLNGQPVYILPEGTQRTIGLDAQRQNIAVIMAVAGAVQSTLGPKGRDKMLVDSMGDVIITNDGATILKQMQVEHPTAKLIVEIAKTQDNEVGDGTTSAVILAGGLAKKASELLDQDIHASTIISGYKNAARKTEELLSASAEEIKLNDLAALKKVAMISLGSKSVSMGSAKDNLAELVVQAVTQVVEKRGEKVTVDKDFIKIEKKQGGNVEETNLIRGVLVDKEIVHPGMPKHIENPKIALIDTALEIEKTEIDAKISITSPDQMEAFLDQEEKMLKTMVEKIAKSGANLVFCQKGIDDVAQHFLSKKGISVARRVKKSDMEKLSKATGARIITTLDDLSEKDLGTAGLAEERKIAGENMIFVEKCKEPKAVTLLVRGSTEHIVDEAERAFNDAIGAVISSIEVGKIVYGGGAIEIEVANQLRKYSAEVGGREQLAIKAFADAPESIPKTLAENSGMDIIDSLVDLRAKHEKGEKTLGINVYTAKLEDMKKNGVIEPLKIKTQAISSATEVVTLILRIDDIIAAKSRGPAMPPGGMGGMPGMEGY